MSGYEIKTWNFDPDHTWLTADTHFGHDNVIGFSKRPFANVEDMNRALLDNLHACVGRSDTLIHLGDVAWRGNGPEVFKSLPGKRKFLVRGNHDRGPVLQAPWDLVTDYMDAVFQVPGQSKLQVVLSHYPMASWRAANWSLHLHGHTHGVVPAVATEGGGRIDAGVDTWNYRPIRIADALARIALLRSAGTTLTCGKDY